MTHYTCIFCLSTPARESLRVALQLFPRDPRISFSQPSDHAARESSRGRRQGCGRAPWSRPWFGCSRKGQGTSQNRSALQQPGKSQAARIARPGSAFQGGRRSTGETQASGSTERGASPSPLGWCMPDARACHAFAGRSRGMVSQRRALERRAVGTPAPSRHRREPQISMSP